MNVLFLSTGYPTEEGTWWAVFHRTVCEALVRNGAKVKVIAPIPWVPWPLHGAKNRWNEYHRTPRRYAMGGVLVERPRYLAPPRGNNWFWTHELFRWLAERSLKREPADVVHAQFAFPPGLAATRITKNGGPPCVMVLHGSDVNAFPNVNALNRLRFCESVREAGEVLAVSGALAKRTLELTGRLPLIRPIGLNLANFLSLPSRSSAREQIGLRHGVRYILFVGRLCREKGVGLLLQALCAQTNDSIKGLFVGDGPMREEVKQARNVMWLGSRSNSEIPLIMRAADVFALPSESEGMPTVLVEAGAAGTPVVATCVGGIPELLADDRGLLVKAGDLNGLRSALYQTLNDKAQTELRVCALRDHVFRTYNADSNARELIAIFNRVQRRSVAKATL